MIAAWLRWALAIPGYWLRPYDMLLDARRWRWQPRGVCQFQTRGLVSLDVPPPRVTPADAPFTDYDG